MGEKQKRTELDRAIDRYRRKCQQFEGAGDLLRRVLKTNSGKRVRVSIRVKDTHVQFNGRLGYGLRHFVPSQDHIPSATIAFKDEHGQRFGLMLSQITEIILNPRAEPR